MSNDLHKVQKDAVKLKQKDIQVIKNKILKEQKYRCGLCGINLTSVPSRTICLDHDHTTGFIRGVLCSNCNGGEGKVKTQATRCKRGGSKENWIKSVLLYWLIHSVPQTNYIHPSHKTVQEKRLSKNKKAREKRNEIE